jgi:ABC-type nitrate/sulfonate/bicarbonate transport system substrate-binding protein
VANRDFAERKPELVKRYLDTYKKIIDWAYGTDDALERWMEVQKLNRTVALKGRDSGFPKRALTLSPISGLDLTMQQAVEQKRLAKPMSSAEIEEMLKYVRRFTT